MIIFNQYIHFPVYWFSRLANYHKLILVSIYIILIPVSPLYMLVLHHILIILLWRLEFKPYPMLYRYWCRTSIILYCVYCAFGFMASTGQIITICIPYHIKINKYYINIGNLIAPQYLSISCNIYSIYRYFYIDIPLLLTRSYFVFLNYLSLYNFVILTTSPEQLIINLVNLVKNKSKIMQESIIIVMLSSEIISILNSKLHNTQKCFILRGLNRLQLSSYCSYLLGLVMYKYKKLYITMINNSIYAIYSRELLLYDIDLWLVI
uniref:Conserved_ORF_5 protein n=1 Tax=Titanophycus setchellii TaxID=940129 RepID=A0A1G4NY08_9FLOR|nr:hypothetical protein P8471_pgp125 [Titanophycus setchellii]SCW23583.1 conserved_ORF_5 [Titanophycus setchellii]